jgi:hypothetical protein
MNDLSLQEDRPLATQSTAIDVGGMVAQIMAAATNPDVDADKAQKMLAMALELQDRQARQLFYQAKARVQAQMPRVTKNGVIYAKDGVTIRSRFATYDEIDSVIRPILIEHGLAVGFDGGLFDGDRFVVTMTVSHDAGHVEQHKITMPMADIPGCSSPQKMTATQSYARRSGITQFFNIVTEGSDTGLPLEHPTPEADPNAPAEQTRQQAQEPTASQAQYLACKAEWWKQHGDKTWTAAQAKEAFLAFILKCSPGCNPAVVWSMTTYRAICSRLGMPMGDEA